MSKISVVRHSLLLSALAVSSVAFADPTCTTQPKSSWIPFEQAKAQIVNMGYKIKKFKTTRTHCYELYGYSSADKHVEIYFNPVDMSIVKEENDE